MSIKIKLDYVTQTGEYKTKSFEGETICNVSLVALDYVIEHGIGQFVLKHITATIATQEDLKDYKELYHSSSIYRKSPDIFLGMKRKAVFEIITKNLNYEKI